MNYLIGHLCGDFLFQNDFMAMNKKDFTLKGWIACVLHCFLYSIAMGIFTGWWDYRFWLVFFSHMLLDKTYLVVYFMRLTGSFKRIIADKNNPSAIWAYCIVDNSFHLISLWTIARYLP
jgi:hypothetical protein